MDSWMREHNIAVFEDTCLRCREDPGLAKAVDRSLSGQRIVLEGDDIRFTKVRGNATRVVVSRTKSFQTAMKYAGRRVAVLNFANWYNPGGGVAEGCGSQEEALCRCSTLYPCISDGSAATRFYGPHLALRDFRANDDLIYTPGVRVFRGDDYPNDVLEEGRRFDVDVVTCAAPCLGWDDLSDGELHDIHVRRLNRILEAACGFGDTHVILGAFGCGAFANDPEVAASAAEEVLKEWDGCFEVVDFAVFTTERERANYVAFSRLDGLFGSE